MAGLCSVGARHSPLATCQSAGDNYKSVTSGGGRYESLAARCEFDSAEDRRPTAAKNSSSMIYAQAKPDEAALLLWQGLLIVLPVVLLAALGLLSLRQDRRLANKMPRTAPVNSSVNWRQSSVGASGSARPLPSSRPRVGKDQDDLGSRRARRMFPGHTPRAPPSRTWTRSNPV